MRDVAQAAGVSHQTVSRVINESARVNEETRARVQAVIARLGYRPNALARSMARGRSGMFACIAPNLTDYTFAGIIDGAEREAREQGYFLLSASAPDVPTFRALIEQLVHGRRIEGVLVINPFADERHRWLSAEFPTVVAGVRPRSDSALHSVALDDVAVGRQATEHLLALGHTAIGMITGPMAEDCAQDRQAGFLAALADAGLATRPDWIISGDWTAPSGYAALAQLAATGELPTAVFSQNDQMALGLLRAAQEIGLHAPADLSVIGVDDIPLVSYFTPPLTTLRQEFDQIGRQATRLLIAALDDPTAAPRRLRLPARLIVRGSTGPLHAPPRDFGRLALSEPLDAPETAVERLTRQPV